MNSNTLTRAAGMTACFVFSVAAGDTDVGLLFVAGSGFLASWVFVDITKGTDEQKALIAIVLFVVFGTAFAFLSGYLNRELFR